MKLVVPWPTGGLVDALGRVVAEKLQASMGQPFVVDNRAGAGGMLGAEAVVKSEPDGYMLMLTTSALTINAALQPETRVDVPDATVSDAVMMLDLRHTNALLFRNVGSGAYNMVYRRGDGTIGWVEPQRAA